VVISNCVINLSPDKPRVFKEAFRVLRPGGRLMVSDIVLLRRLPQRLLDDAEAYSACISGAALKSAYLRMIRDAGFERVKVTGQKAYPVEFLIDDAGAIQTFLEDTGLPVGELKRAGEAIVSVSVIAHRPE